MSTTTTQAAPHRLTEKQRLTLRGKAEAARKRLRRAREKQAGQAALIAKLQERIRKAEDAHEKARRNNAEAREDLEILHDFCHDCGASFGLMKRCNLHLWCVMDRSTGDATGAHRCDRCQGTYRDTKGLIPEEGGQA
jgi:hypothetical protein